MLNNTNKVALITGASRGIGEAIASDLAKSGIDVAIGFLKNENKALQVCKKLKKSNIESIPVKIDLESSKSIKDAVQFVMKKLGPINILVNNAAIHIDNDFLNISEQEWDKIYNINIKAPFILTQQVLPNMLEKRYGKIINISSIAASIGGVKSIPYAGAKASLVNLTRSLARLYSSKKVYTFCINPSLVKTDMSKGIDFSKAIKSIPAKRIGEYNDISKLVLFLCGDDASYLSGQTFNSNGAEYFAV